MKTRIDITFDTIVRQYKARQPDRHIEYCLAQTSLSKVIGIASMAVDHDNKKHVHQKHISPTNLFNFAGKLKLKKPGIKNAQTFDEIFSIVDSISCYGIGELAKYDICKRIGEYLTLVPDKVFLHRGTRIGAINLLGQLSNRKLLTLDKLPPAFQERNLTASEIEDILCIYKNNFKKIMKKNIELKYRHVPKEIIDDLKTNLDKSFSLSISNEKEEYSNFTGGPADIIIFIDEHLTELIIGGLLVNATYDGLKYAIQLLWKKIVASYSKQKNKFQTDKNYIELKFKLKPNKTLEFNLNGDIDEKIINDLTNNIFSYLRNKEQRQNDFKNPRFKDNTIPQTRIKMTINPKTKKMGTS